jgi:hypothetical protein
MSSAFVFTLKNGSHVSLSLLLGHTNVKRPIRNLLLKEANYDVDAEKETPKQKSNF